MHQRPRGVDASDTQSIQLRCPLEEEDEDMK